MNHTLGPVTDTFRREKKNPRERLGDLWKISPIWVAAALGHGDIVKVLLDNGANPENRGLCAMTPLQIAYIEGHGAVMQLLQAAGGRLPSNADDAGDNE